MWRIIKFIFTGDWHLHEWEVIRTNEVVSPSSRKKYGKLYTLRCKHCGNIKKKQVDAT